MAIEKKYYSLNETLTELEAMGLTLEVVRGCTLEGLIHPVVYIDSLPAYACEANKNGNAIAVGRCLLSCHVNLYDEISPAMDFLIRGGSFFIRSLVKKTDIIGLPLMFCWEHDPQVFSKVPLGYANPKPLSDISDIRYFFLLSADMKHVELSAKNITILSEDFKFLEEKLCKKSVISTEDQPLTRSAIKNNYINIKPTAWEKIFQRENENGFIDAKITDTNPFMYSKQAIEKWLIANNHYKIHELSSDGIHRKYQSPSDFSDIRKLAK